MSFQHSLTLARTVWSHRIDQIPLLQVFVRDNNVDQALRVLKKKMQRERVFREMRRRRFLRGKPSEKAAREKSDAVRRLRKCVRKQAIRDGLIAVKPRNQKMDSKRATPVAG